MPELPIVDPEGKLLPYASFIVLAYTTYSDDLDKLEEMMASALVADVLEAEGKDSAPALLGLATANPWLIPALYRGSSPEKMLKEAMQAYDSAWAAGEILLTMLSVSTFHPEISVNVRMTVEVISEFQREDRQIKVAASESTLWNSWSRFKSVAHFHAVRQAWSTSIDAPGPKGFILWRMHRFEDYLACAEDYRKQALSRRILTFDETWRTPDNLPLPSEHIEVVPPVPELLEIFRRYRP